MITLASLTDCPSYTNTKKDASQEYNFSTSFKMTWHHLGRDTHSCSLQIIIEYFWLRKGIFWLIPFEYTTSCNPSPFSVGMTCVLVLTNRIWQMSWCVTHLITLHYTRLFCLQACSSYLHDEITGHIGEVQMASNCWWYLRDMGSLEE